ncbi:MAG: hypothetical protein Q3999_05575 [Buchananella hordeovulneris]|nr:hypothetical protein [Buchananella hordeovulneris]
MQALEPFQALAFFDSEDGERWIFLMAGPISALAFYSYIFVRYRNTDKRHAFEHETEAQMLDVEGQDQKIGEVKGVRRRYIEGDLKHSPLTRLGQNTVIRERR